MNLIYSINFTGHDEWMENGYSLNLAHGDVVTRDGEIIGQWRVTGYDPEVEYSSGQYEFTIDGQKEITFSKGFTSLDSRISRGSALSDITSMIGEWYEAE